MTRRQLFKVAGAATMAAVLPKALPEAPGFSWCGIDRGVADETFVVTWYRDGSHWKVADATDADVKSA